MIDSKCREARSSQIDRTATCCPISSCDCAGPGLQREHELEVEASRTSAAEAGRSYSDAEVGSYCAVDIAEQLGDCMNLVSEGSVVQLGSLEQVAHHRNLAVGKVDIDETSRRVGQRTRARFVGLLVGMLSGVFRLFKLSE